MASSSFTAKIAEAVPGRDVLVTFNQDYDLRGSVTIHPDGSALGEIDTLNNVHLADMAWTADGTGTLTYPDGQAEKFDVKSLFKLGTTRRVGKSISPNAIVKSKTQN